MPCPDQSPHPASDPAGPGNPEPVHHVYLSTDIRPAIRAATAGQMRAALAEIARHLCSQLNDPPAAILPPGPDTGGPWRGCQAGSGTRAGFQLYHHALQAVAGHYLHALGFDPARAAADGGYLAAAISPFLAARKQRLRRALLGLVDCLDATVSDADIAAGAAARLGLPGDVWEAGTGVITGIGLYRHAARVMAVHILFYVWDALDITGQPQAFRPFTDADFFAAHLN